MSKKNVSSLQTRPVTKVSRRVIHTPLIWHASELLDKTLLRTIPFLFGSFLALITLVLFLTISYVFGYHIISLESFGVIFLLGFLIGIIYEYLSLLLRSTKK